MPCGKGEEEMTFDATINLGHILTFLGFVIGGLGVAYAMREEVRTLAGDMTDVKQELKKLSDVLIALARQDEQFKALTRRLEQLERDA